MRGGKMKAFVITAPNQFGMQANVPVPEIGPDEVLLKTLTSGICHSDYDLMRGQYILPLHFPVTPGHEFAAEAVEVGVSVKDIKKGDRVVGECNIGCGVCPVCEEGAESFCPNAEHFGFTISGSDAEYFKAKAAWLHVLPKEVNDMTGALVEPFSVAYKGIHVAGGIDAADTCVIYGGGSIGACAVATSRAMGARTVVVEPVAFKREVCKKLGADLVLDPARDDVIAEVKKLTGALGGADIVMDCTGNAKAMVQMFDVARNGGRVVFVGINFQPDVPVPIGVFQKKGISAIGSNGSSKVWDRCIRFLAQSKLDLSPIQTHTFSLKDAEKAFEFTKDPKNQTIKVTMVNDL
jgi:L-iditol 2-dehydrogenase